MPPADDFERTCPISPCSPDWRRSSQQHPQTEEEEEEEEEFEEDVVDIFGIPIPPKSSKRRNNYDFTTEDSDFDELWNSRTSFLSTSKMGGPSYSVLLAESPSRLDLSALLC